MQEVVPHARRSGRGRCAVNSGRASVVSSIAAGFVVKRRVILAAAIAVTCAGSHAMATPLYWDGSTSTGWDAASNWSTDPNNPTPDPANPPGIGDLATFNTTGLVADQTINLNGNQSALGLVVNTTGAVTLQGGGTDRVLTLGGSGILLNSGVGNLTIGSATSGQGVALTLAGSQAWNNSSTAGLVTINNNVSLGNAGTATLTLNGAPSGTTTSSVVNGVISDGPGTLGVTLNGNANARWTLAGANTYSGATNVTSGFLFISNNASLGSTAGATTVGPNGALMLSNGITVSGETLNLSGDGNGGQGGLRTIAGTNRWTGLINVTANSGNTRIGADAGSTLILDGNIAANSSSTANQLVFQVSGTITVNGVISGNAPVTKSATGTGTLSFLGNNTYTGVTMISSGTLQIGGGGTSGSLGTGNVVNNAAVTFNRSDSIVVPNVISGSGALNMNSAGTLTLTGANSYTGKTTITNGGTVNVSQLGISGETSSSLGAPTTAGNRTIALGSSSTVAGILNYIGPGTTTDRPIDLANSNGQSALRANGTGTLVWTGGASGAHSFILGGAGNGEFQGVLNLTAGALRKVDTGTWVLSPSTPDLIGTAGTLSGGTLTLDFKNMGTPTDLVNSTFNPTITSTALNVIGKSTGATSQTLSGIILSAGSSSINVNSNGGDSTTLALGGITRSAAGSTLNFTLPASGSITTTKANTAGTILGAWATVGLTDWATSAGDGTTAGPITALSTYTANAWAAGNNTDVTSSNSPASGSTTNSLRFNTAAATTVTLAGNNTISSGGILVTPNVGANLSQITGGTITNGGELIVTQNNTAGGLTINTIISGGTLTKAGNGLVTLGSSTVNTMTSTTIDAGTLSVANPNQLGPNAGPGVITFAAGGTGTLQLTGNNTFSSSKGITLNGNGIVDVPQQATLTSTTTTVAIQGAGGLTKTGAGTLTFSNATNANTYTGPTTITGGTISVTTLANGGSNSGIGASSNDPANLVLNGGGLRYAAPTNAATTDRLFTVGTAGGTLEASGGSGASVTFTNSGAIALAGAGTRLLTLTGTNTDGNSIAAPLGDNGGATSVQKNGVGTWRLAGTNTYSGGTTIAGGTLAATNVGALGTGNVTVQTTAVALTITGTSAAIADTATLALAGGGTANTADAGYANLGTGVNEFVGSLVLGSVFQGPGTYGSTLSNATFKNDEYFSGEGVVTVVPEPTSVGLALGAAGLLLLRRRRGHR